jgi:DNA-binding PadR family transcriptional regulator
MEQSRYIVTLRDPRLKEESMNSNAAFAEGAFGGRDRREWWPRGQWLAMMMAARRGRRHGRPPFGAWWGSWGPPGQFFTRGPKVGRGDVRTAILVLLAEEPMHGYQVIQELTERSEGVWRPSPGSIYPTLQQLEDEGLVRSVESDGRRVYHLTDVGKAEVERRGGEAPAPWEVAADADPLSELREVGFGVAAAVMQVAHTGSDHQVARAKEILIEARKNLYRLLAEDERPTEGNPPGD